jgi:hypothetical protein
MGLNFLGVQPVMQDERQTAFTTDANRKIFHYEASKP